MEEARKLHQAQKSRNMNGNGSLERSGLLHDPFCSCVFPDAQLVSRFSRLAGNALPRRDWPGWEDGWLSSVSQI